MFNFSDRDIARAATIFSNRQFGVGHANRSLQEICYHIQPDLLLLGHADIIKPKTLANIRQYLPSIKILQWNVEGLFTRGNISKISSKFEMVDATLVTTAGEPLVALASMTDGAVGFMPNSVDFSAEVGCNHKKDLPYDVFFSCASPAGVRNVCGVDWFPEKLIQYIEQAVPGIRLYLAGFRGHPTHVGTDYQKALESASIGLNLSEQNHNPLYTSDRIAPMCGNGMAILIDRATCYDQLFHDNEFAFFSTIDELVEQTRRLISDVPFRKALATAGRERYHKLFNERIVAQYLLEVVFGTLDSSDYAWPTLVK